MPQWMISIFFCIAKDNYSSHTLSSDKLVETTLMPDSILSYSSNNQSSDCLIEFYYR